MANEQQQTQPQVAIPLPKGKKNALMQWDMYSCSLFLPEWEYPL